MSEIKGEKYPQLIFEEPNPVEEALDFGAVIEELSTQATSAPQNGFAGRSV